MLRMLPTISSLSLASMQQPRPRATAADPVVTGLPLQLQQGDRIALIGNTLLERSQEFGHFEAMLHQTFPELNLVVRHLAWSADEIGLQPRPANFADTEQHLVHEKSMSSLPPSVSMNRLPVNRGCLSFSGSCPHGCSHCEQNPSTDGRRPEWC